MSDLISRKKVIDILEKEKNLKCGYDSDIAILSIEKGIRELPTAYDIDKVVEEIIEEAHNTIVDFKLDKYVYTCKAIEIVKQGGVRKDVCEWKYNDSEYYFESYCDHLHIFMSDGPKENEYAFCPYCGKKIKVVE